MMVFRPFLVLPLACLFCAGIGLAQPTCVQLMESFRTAIDTAEAYGSTTYVKQGDKEIYYLLTDNTRDETGEWVLEKVEERSNLPFGGGDGFGGRSDEDGSSAEESCQGATVEKVGELWHVDIPPEEDSPVTQWRMSFAPYRDTYVPDTMTGSFDVKILLIPFRGTFTTSFHDWTFPLTYVSPGER